MCQGIETWIKWLEAVHAFVGSVGSTLLPPTSRARQLGNNGRHFDSLWKKARVSLTMMATILTLYEKTRVSCYSIAAILSIYEKAFFSIAMMAAILTLYEKHVSAVQ
jgi:hypothetical protein